LGADFAGEGSGQVMFPKLHPGSDGIAAVVFILANLARRDEDIATIIGRLPPFHMIKENVLLAPDALYRKIQVFRSEAEKREQSWRVDLTDGIKMESDDGWIHVRASSTESMLRIITESPERAKAEEFHRWAHDLLVE
jgi:phosphomannomutase